MFCYDAFSLNVTIVEMLKIHKKKPFEILSICRNNLNPNYLDNKGSWRILKDFNCSVTMLSELELIGSKQGSCNSAAH